MIDPALLKKIRKCLALSSSANEHEAAAALATARRLMAEHGVTEEALAMAEIEEATARASRTKRPPRWESYLVAAIHRALDVVGLIDERGDRTFVGRGPRAEIAAYAFAALFRQLKKARAEYIGTKLRRCKPGRKRARADAFCEGWAASVLGKIIAIAPEWEEDPLAQQYLAERFPHAVTVNSRSGAPSGAVGTGDWFNGRAAGQAVELHHGVGGSAGMELLA